MKSQSILAIMLAVALLAFAGCSNGKKIKCAYSGCENNIASSGESFYCATHSDKCLSCGKSIDKGAEYCISCLEKQLSGLSKGSTSKSSVTRSNDYDYDMPNENDKSFSDYVKRVDPELYDSMVDNYYNLTK